MLVPTKKQTILGLGVRFRVWFTISVRIRVKVRENRILNGNQWFGPRKDCKTNVCVCVGCSATVCGPIGFVPAPRPIYRSLFWNGWMPGLEPD